MSEVKQGSVPCTCYACAECCKRERGWRLDAVRRAARRKRNVDALTLENLRLSRELRALSQRGGL